MRISIFVPKMSGGGIARTRATLAEGFVAVRGTEVDFVLETTGGSLQNLIPREARVFEVGQLRFWRLIWALKKYLSEERPDVMLTSKEIHTFAVVIARWISRSQTRIFATVHGDFRMRLLNNRKKSEIYWIPIAVRFFYSMIEGVTAVSKGVGHALPKETGLSARRIYCIYDPYDLPLIRREAEAGVQHLWLHEDREMPCILAAGRLAAQKDYETLLVAHKKLQKISPVRLIILGEGPEKIAIKNMIQELGTSDLVDLVGFVKNPFPYMVRADAFVLSSIWEGLGGVLVQALALGVPIVATDCPHGPREVLDDGRLGELVPVRDPDALANAIHRTLKSPPNRERLRASAERFAKETIAAAYLKLFSSLEC